MKSPVSCVRLSMAARTSFHCYTSPTLLQDVSEEAAARLRLVDTDAPISVLLEYLPHQIARTWDDEVVVHGGQRLAPIRSDIVEVVHDEKDLVAAESSLETTRHLPTASLGIQHGRAELKFHGSVRCVELRFRDERATGPESRARGVGSNRLLWRGRLCRGSGGRRLCAGWWLWHPEGRVRRADFFRDVTHARVQPKAERFLADQSFGELFHD
jgi:hypothetical protein